MSCLLRHRRNTEDRGRNTVCHISFPWDWSVTNCLSSSFSRVTRQIRKPHRKPKKPKALLDGHQEDLSQTQVFLVSIEQRLWLVPTWTRKLTAEKSSLQMLSHFQCWDTPSCLHHCLKDIGRIPASGVLPAILVRLVPTWTKAGSWQQKITMTNHFHNAEIETSVVRQTCNTEKGTEMVKPEPKQEVDRKSPWQTTFTMLR